jgi:predicted permease
MQWFRQLLPRANRYNDLTVSIREHLAERIEELMDAGMSQKEAERAARREFGNVTLIEERSREVWQWRGIESMFADLRHAIRGMLHAPGFAAIGILTLALGIGLNSAMFSVIYSVLFRGLPYPDAGRLLHLMRVDGNADSATIPEYDFWKEHSRSFSAVTGLRGADEQRLLTGTEHQWITTLTVSTDFLHTLNVSPALGREFNTAETHPGGPRAIILSDGLWRRSFGADLNVLGRAVRLGDASYTVVGVLPANFWFPQSSDALVPLRPSGNLSDLGSNTGILARLKDGITVAEARSEMKILTDEFRRSHGEVSRYSGLTVIPFRDWLVGSTRSNLMLLFGATGLVLLISCSNLAVLLITRFQARRKESALRLALGCGRRRLLLQYFIENILLAALGSAVGLVLCFVLIRVLVATAPFHLPTSTPIRIDWPVLGFAIAVAFAIALAFTLIPVFATMSVDVNDALKEGGRTAAGAVRTRGRSILIVTEVALSTVLLIAAGLLIHSLYRLSRQQLGFDPHRVITFETPFDPARAKNPADRNLFTQSMLNRLRAAPGVEYVAASNVIPLVGWGNLPTQREGHDEQSIGGMEVRIVTDDYFNALRIPILRGGGFSTRDTAVSPPVAAINETLARTWYSSGNPLGDSLIIGRFRGREYLKDAPREIVGVVANTKTLVKDKAWPTVFVPLAQAESLPSQSLTWIIRFRHSSAAAADLRRAAASVDPEQRIEQFQSMDDIVAKSTADSRFNTLLFSIFGFGALALAAIGVYGLVSFLVAQRRHEIGTRMALGAMRPDILHLFLRQGIALTVLGLVFGLIGAFMATHFMAGLLFGVQAHDALTFFLAPLALLAAASIANLFPAWRAAKTDPMLVLRYE